jgi:hypothetical protein
MPSITEPVGFFRVADSSNMALNRTLRDEAAHRRPLTLGIDILSKECS